MGIQGKVELQFNCSKDTHQMWQGIQTITDYKAQTQICFTAAGVSFYDELNMFYARFELANEDSPMRAPRAPHDSSCIPEADMRKRLTESTLAKLLARISG